MSVPGAINNKIDRSSRAVSPRKLPPELAHTDNSPSFWIGCNNTLPLHRLVLQRQTQVCWELIVRLRIVSLILLVVFSTYTAYTMFTAEQSLLEFGLGLLSSTDTAQVVFDLYIMAFLAIVWMYYDSKKSGRSLIYLLPFVLLTLVFVSIGPLLYLVLRPSPGVKFLPGTEDQS